MAVLQTDAIQDLRADLLSAIDLRDVSLGRSFDRTYASNGGRIVYAIDSVILHGLFDGEWSPTVGPSGRRPDEKRRNSRVTLSRDNYQIFSGPRTAKIQGKVRADQTKLGPVILWYLLEGVTETKASPAPRFLLLPGHDFEARRLYDGIVESFDKQRNSVSELHVVAENIRRLASSPQSSTSAVVRQKLIDQLYGILYDIRAPHDKFGRFNRLLNSRRVMRLSTAAREEAFRDPTLIKHFGHVFEAPRRPFFGNDSLDEGSSSWWSNALHGQLPERYADNDRIALSALDTANRHLDPAKARIVLYTDNTKLLAAGSKYWPFRGVRDDIYSQLSFADLYMRHPKSLLIDSTFLRPTARTLFSEVSQSEEIASAYEIDGWLDTLLAATLDEASIEPPNATDDLETYPAVDEQAAELARIDRAAHRWLAFRARQARLSEKLSQDERLDAALTRNRSLHERFVTRWSNYIETLTAGHSTISPFAEDTIQDVLDQQAPESTTSVERLLSAVQSEVRHLSETSWSDFFNTAADTGLELINLPSADHYQVVWPVPSLVIRGRGERHDAIRALWSSEGFLKAPSEILQMVGALQVDRGLENAYVHALCYGLMFAHVDRWPLTKLLAERALHIARTLAGRPDEALRPSSSPRITGREANYLLAVALRTMAKTKEQLVAARTALEAARNSREDPAEVEDNGPHLTGLRFDVEEVSIDMAEAAAAFNADSRSLDVTRIGDLRNRMVEILSSASDCEEPLIQAQAKIALRSDYFYSLLFSRDAAGLVETSTDTQSLVKLLVGEQLTDITLAYRDHRRVPLRDKALLRLGAAAGGVFDTLPLALKAPVLERVSQSQGNLIHPRDRRRLARIEKAALDQLAQLADANGTEASTTAPPITVEAE